MEERPPTSCCPEHRGEGHQPLEPENHHFAVNDRGPFVKGRIIDLSYGAARDLDVIGPGVVDVKVEALARSGKRERPGRLHAPHRGAGFSPRGVHHSGRRIRESAERSQVAERLRGSLDEVRITVYEDAKGKIFHRVQASKSETLDQAEAMEKKLEQWFPECLQGADGGSPLILFRSTPEVLKITTRLSLS